MGQIEVVRVLLESDEPLTSRQIAEASGRVGTGGDCSQVSNALRRLVKHGEVRRIHDRRTNKTRYELTEDARRGYE